MMTIGFVRIILGDLSLFIDLAALNITYSISNIGSSFFRILLRKRFSILVNDGGLINNANFLQLLQRFLAFTFIYFFFIFAVGPTLLSFIIGDTEILIERSYLYLTASIVILSVLIDYFNYILLIANKYSNFQIAFPLFFSSIIILPINYKLILDGFSLKFPLSVICLGLILAIILQLRIIRKLIKLPYRKAT
tara:strand:- start:146 stop:724 length:579 start_codon:yes stop_codon:yes gene_type:complete